MSDNTNGLKYKKINMKAILEFDFDKEGSDDRDQFQDAINGWRWKMSVSELDNWLRNEIKYAHDGMSNDTYEAFKQCREKLTEIVHNENLTFE